MIKLIKLVNSMFSSLVIPTLEVKIIPSKDRLYLGDQLTLQCLVSGDPSARVEWKSMSQSGPFPDNVIIRSSTLLINGVKSENGGIYRYGHSERSTW